MKRRVGYYRDDWYAIFLSKKKDDPKITLTDEEQKWVKKATDDFRKVQEFLLGKIVRSEQRRERNIKPRLLRW